MGQTNLLLALERKLATLMGELIAKREEIERIEELAAKLPELRDRSTELETLIDASETLLKSIKPGWVKDTVDPVRPFVHQIPIKLGDTSRKALEVLRTATEPLTTREITEEVLRREGITDASVATREKVRNAIDASLRKRRGTIVEANQQWPQKWYVILSNSQ